jgi:two-component system response regulator BaeR
MVTPRVEEIDRLLGLGGRRGRLYLQTFSAREVVARVKAVLRGTNPEPRSRVRGSKSTRRDDATLDRARLDLTPVEFASCRRLR